jgi:FkbM family methyltransferase
MRKPAFKNYYKNIKNIKNRRFVVSIAFILALWQLLASNFSSSLVYLIKSRDTQSYHHPLLQLSLGNNIIKYHNEQEKQNVLNLDITTTNTTINLQDNIFECEWSAYISTTGKKVEMCVHPFNDIVSNSVRHSHRWGDCNILPNHWRRNAGDKSIYVEIGANIGTCVLEMLLSTDAPIIAFEPNPRNFFALSNTIQRLDESYKKRVVLIPVALGDKRGTNKIYAASDNMGNSVVGKVIKDFNNQVFSKGNQFDIQIERIDNILNPKVEIALMKMDAQGCKYKLPFYTPLFVLA